MNVVEDFVEGAKAAAKGTLAGFASSGTTGLEEGDVESTGTDEAPSDGDFIFRANTLGEHAEGSSNCFDPGTNTFGRDVRVQSIGGDEGGRGWDIDGGLGGSLRPEARGCGREFESEWGDDEVAALVRSLGDEGLAAVVAVVETDLRDLIRVKIRGVVVGA